jgi:hypothetical protein
MLDLRTKILSKPESQSQILIQNLKSLLSLMKIPENVNEITQEMFDLGMARIEKRSIMTFVSKLY